MKKIVLAVTLALGVISTSVYASFPVNKDDAKQEVIVKNNDNVENVIVENSEEAIVNEEMSSSAAQSGAPDDFVILVLLWFFLGGFAAHRWYAGKDPLINILFILTAGGCGIWWLIDGINIFTGKF